MTTRFRSRSVPFEPNLECKVTWPDGSPYVTQGTPASSSTAESMTDEVSPGYYASRRSGGFLPINDMTQSKSEITQMSTGVAKFDMKYNGVTSYYADYSGPLALHGHVHHFGATWSPVYSGAPPSWPSTSPVLTESLANARSRGWDVLTFMVEFRKTVELIRRFGDRTLRRAERIADTISSNAVDPLAEFSATWLEGRYGWRILAYDLEAINEAVHALNEARPPFLRGYATESNVASQVISNYTTAANYLKKYTPNYQNTVLYAPASFTIEQSLEREVRAGVVLELVLDSIFEIDPLVTAWEVIPFSFIIDWFVNVGETITAFSPFASENLLGGWIKETETLTSTTTFQPATSGNPSSGWHKVLLSGAGPYIFETRSLDVTRTKQLPSANLSFRLNLDELKIVDLASIFMARYGKILGGILKSNRV